MAGMKGADQIKDTGHDFYYTGGHQNCAHFSLNTTYFGQMNSYFRIKIYKKKNNFKNIKTKYFRNEHLLLPEFQTEFML